MGDNVNDEDAEPERYAEGVSVADPVTVAVFECEGVAEIV